MSKKESFFQKYLFSWVKFVSSINYIKLSIYMFFAVFLICLIAVLYLPKNQYLKVGTASPVTIVSNRQFEIQTILDKLISKKQLDQQISEVQDVYTTNRAIERSTKKLLLNFFTEMKSSPVSNNVTSNVYSVLNISKKTETFLRKQDEVALNFIELFSLALVRNIYADGIKVSSDIKPLILQRFKQENISEVYRQTIFELLMAVLEPNLVFDEETTLQKKETIRRRFKPQTTIIKNNQPIVYKGDVLTEQNLEILREIGLFRRHINWFKLFPQVIGIILLIILLERMVTFYIQPDNKQLILMFSIESVYVLVIYFVSLYGNFPDFIEPAYLIPVGLFTFLFGLLVSEQLGLFFGYFNACLMLFLFSFQANAILFVMIITMVVNFYIHRFKARRDLPLIGFYVGLVSAVVVLIIGWSSMPIRVNYLVLFALQAFVNSIISIILAIGSMLYLQNIFDITTDLKLLDYADTNHVLMKRMLNESPGTYYHSLMVSNLAEAAAEAINANGILARVAAYYHDIGKLKKPEYFIENQNQQNNPHDKTMPTLSALTILSHPKDGLELAKKYKLPKEVQQIILEHHGTSLLVYFYYKMLRITVHDVVEESQFRYDCPRPTSQESAVILLADSVEASVRSIEKPTPNKLRTLIDKIVRDKLDDGQLDKSNLTLANIEEVKEVFFNVISNQYHSRIKYPEEHERVDDEQQNKS